MKRTKPFFLAVQLLLLLQRSNGAIHPRTPNRDGRHTGFITREAQQTLFDYVIGDLGQIGEILPIKRPDLPEDYVAYIEVTFPAQNTFMIVSTGPETGDYRVPLTGELPSLTQLARSNAEQRGTSCATYMMLSPELLMCDDVTGMAAGSNIPLDSLSSNTSFADLIDINFPKLERNWQEIKQLTSEEWLTSLVMTEGQLREWEELTAPGHEQSEESDVEEMSYPTATDLHDGDDVSIAVGDPDEFDFMEITSISPINEHQPLLCQTVNLCDTENSKRVAPSMITVDDQTGLLHTKTTIEGTSMLTKAGVDELDFLIIIHHQGDKVVIRRYSIKAKTREKRSSSGNVRNCSRWTQRHIPCSDNYFPDYDQHTAGSCAVGCGPVAWAMVFGFYDRAGHASCGRYSSQTRNLYKCSNGGLTGASRCVAPRYNIPPQYTEELNREMGTVCLFEQGATPGWKMNDVESFMSSRVSGASIHLRDCLLTGIYCQRTKNWAKDKIDDGWPVVVGYRLGALSWHYPVATGYRYRRCERRGLFGWNPFTEYEWYLHMGWGAGTTQWRPMEAYTAWTAEF